MGLSRVFNHLVTMDWSIRRHFSLAAMKQIEAAIRESEKLHFGEIRFVVEASLPLAMVLRGISARQRAIDLFSLTRVWDTEHNSGVLIYLLWADRDVEIIADRGIAGRVTQEAWDGICAHMEQAFRRQHFVEGVIQGIQETGTLLANHYPAGDRNPDELPDRPVML